MRYLSVCSGIEAVTVTWQPLGWTPGAFAEIDPFCCWLLCSRYRASRPLHMPSPHDADTRKEAKRRAAAIRNVIALPTTGDIPNFGDFTRIGANGPPNILRSEMAVRRLTPRECERLQGFPDDYTLVEYRGSPRRPADDPRYRALGNSMAVPVMRWIGERIATVHEIVLHRNEAPVAEATQR